MKDKQMLIIDGHLDLAMNALLWNRDLRRTVAEIRDDEREMTDKGRGRGTVAFPEMRAGKIALSFATVIARVNPAGTSDIDFRTHETAYAQAQGQYAYYRELERQGVLKVIDDWPSLDLHLQTWERDPEHAALGIVLSMEGADPIVEPAQVESWWTDRFRIVSLAHYGPSAYAHGTGSVGGLTGNGRLLLRVMERIGMILDVTHLSDDSFWQALDVFGGPVLGTHSNCRALVPGDRQLSDEMLLELIRRDAVIGAALDAWMLQPGWILNQSTPELVSMETYVDQIDHVCQLAGNADHAAIGTDLDGGFGTEATPRDLNTIADLAVVPGLLAVRGYGDADIEKIVSGNWIRLLERVWLGNA